MAVFARNMIPGETPRGMPQRPYGNSTLSTTWITPFFWKTSTLRDGRHAALGVGQDDLAALGAGDQRVAGDGLDGMLAAVLLIMPISAAASTLAATTW